MQNLGTTGSVELERGDRRVALRWSRNRIHFHPRIFRLVFEGFSGVPADETGVLVAALLAEARSALEVHDPLLLRVTLDERAQLLPHLQELGFLFTRGVHILAFDVADLLRAAEEESTSELDLRSFEEAYALASEEELLTVWAEAYGRTARLDPASLEALTAEEKRELFLGDTDLDADVSVCAFVNGRLVGVCPAYRAVHKLERELGTVGIAGRSLALNSGISMAMVQNAAARAASRGVERLVAEVDADAPFSVHAFADLPGRVVESLVSLMFVPKWTTAPARER